MWHNDDKVKFLDDYQTYPTLRILGKLSLRVQNLVSFTFELFLRVVEIKTIFTIYFLSYPLTEEILNTGERGSVQMFHK